MSKLAVKAGLEILASGQNIEALRRLIVMTIVGRYLMPASTNEEATKDDSLSALLSRLPTRNLAAVASISKGKTGIKDARPGHFPLVVTAETRSSADHFDFEGPGVMIPMVSSTGHGDASLKRIHFQDGQYAVGSILAVVHPKDSSVLSARYLHAYLSAFKDELLVSRMVGTANVSLTVAKLSDVPVPLLPIQGQYKVDELMALCDLLEAEQNDAGAAHARLVDTLLGTLTQSSDAAELAANWQRLAEHFATLFTTESSLDALKQTILQLAVMGKLVPQDPNDEPASELLRRITPQGTNSGTSLDEKESRPPGAMAIPSNWRWSSVEQLTKPGETTTYGILKPVWVKGGVPTVRVSEIKRGRIDIENLPTCDPERASRFEKTKLQAHDLLISKDGTIGKTAFVPPVLSGGNITQHMLRFPITDQVDRNYVRVTIDAPFCQAWMLGETKGVALKGVNVGDFRRMPIPLPPLAEQHRIVAKVDELMALCDSLKAGLAESRTQQERLAITLIESALKAA